MNNTITKIRLVFASIAILAVSSLMLGNFSTEEVGFIDNGKYYNSHLGMSLSVANQYGMLYGDDLKNVENDLVSYLPRNPAGNDNLELVAALEAWADENPNQILVFEEDIKGSLLVRGSWDYLWQWQKHFNDTNVTYLMDEEIYDTIISNRIFSYLDVSMFIEGKAVQCRFYSTIKDDKAITIGIAETSHHSSKDAIKTVKSLRFL